MAPGLADRPLAEVLDAVARAEPAPGGGSSSAWACALAAALVEMTAALAGDLADVRDRAAALRAQALRLGEDDLASYARVLAALRVPAGDPGRAATVTGALSDASVTPFAVAEAAAEVADLAARAAAEGGVHARGDAATGAVLAEAACRAAGQLVALNLADAPDDPRPQQAAALAARAATAREAALASSSAAS